MPAPLSMEAFKLLVDSLSNIDRLISEDVNFKNKLASKVLEVSRDFIPYDTGKLNDSAKVKDGMIKNNSNSIDPKLRNKKKVANHNGLQPFFVWLFY